MSTDVLAGEVLPAAGGEGAAVAVLPAGALAGLPGVVAGSELERLLAGWLGTYAKVRNTFDAYRRDITAWLGWCARYGVDPVRATKTHVDLWISETAQTPLERTGRPPAQASLARYVSTAASWFAYLVDIDAAGAVPVRKRTRPKAPAESTTVGLSIDEAVALEQRCVDHEHVRDAAVVMVLRYTGLRVSELVERDLGDMRPEEGHMVLLVTGKGGRRRKVPLAAPAYEAFERYLQHRADQAGVDLGVLLDRVDEPLIAARNGRRLSRKWAARTVRRIARSAGIASWAHLSPHSLRHALATNMLDEGADLATVRCARST